MTAAHDRAAAQRRPRRPRPTPSGADAGEPIVLTHDLEPAKFMWLFSKYVRGVSLSKHCTHAIRGPYGKRLSKHNPDLAATRRLVLDEEPAGTFVAIYVCGVAAAGYRRKQSYPHNLHVAILPAPGREDRLRFETWDLELTNGVFDPIPGLEELPPELRSLPDDFTTCRIFRWAALRGAQLVSEKPSIP